MDDFTTRTYGTSGLDNRPLFGETSARERIINLVVGVLTTLLVLITVISSFVVPLPPKPINIFLAVCVLLLCGSVLVLIFWYRQGDLEPKFRKLIYYMLSSIALLCICANLYFHDVGRVQPASAL